MPYLAACEPLPSQILEESLMLKPKHLVLCAALAIAVSASNAVMAQAVLEEIIVTAEKRTASLQDVPIAVSAFSQDDLDRGLILNTMDLQLQTPNLFMRRDHFTGVQLSIRGIGNAAVATSSDGAVGVHLNGVYLNNSRIFETGFFDAERVEVLRGPQGTLFGRNTTAGVINVITAKPELDEMTGHLEVTAGEYSERRIKGMLNVPLSDTLGFRVAGLTLSRDGYLKNIAPGFEGDLDGRDMWQARFSLRWNPTEELDVNLVVDALDESSNRTRSQKQACNTDRTINFAGQYGTLGCLPQPSSGPAIYGVINGAGTSTGQFLQLLAGPLGGILSSPLLGAPGGFPLNDFEDTVTPQDVRTVAIDFMPEYRADNMITSLEISQDIGDLNLMSLTAYNEGEIWAAEDYDRAIPSANWTPQLNAISAAATFGLAPQFAPFQYELGVPMYTYPLGGHTATRPDQPLRFSDFWGADTTNSDYTQWSQEFRLSSDFDGDLNFLLGAFYLEYENANHYWVMTSGLSLFGQINGLPPNMQHYHSWTPDYDLETWAVFGELYYDISDTITSTLGLRYSDETKATQQRVVYMNIFANPNLPGGDFDYYGVSFDEVTGRANLTWNVTDDLMAYAQLSRSYKSGGMNPLNKDNPLVDPAQGGDPSNQFFLPEFIDALEVGVKSTLLDGAMRLNGTAFIYDYQDRQVSRIFQQTAINQNIDAEIWGAEVETQIALSENFFVTAQVSLLNTEIKNFSNIDDQDPTLDGSSFTIFDCIGNNLVAQLNPGGPPGPVNTCLGSPLPFTAGFGTELSMDGNELFEAPESSYTVTATYSIGVASEMDLTLSTTYYWQDSYFMRPHNRPFDRIPSWKVWNASALLEGTGDSDWYAEAWVKNIRNDDFLMGVYSSGAASGMFSNRMFMDPRTLGVTVGFRW